MVVMPAYPTHTFFSHLVLQALLNERHALAPIAARHAALFRIAGIAGCDIQCMPYQICRQCGAPYRHNQKENRTCLVCRRDALEDFSFQACGGRSLTRVDVERLFYSHTHLVLHNHYRGYGVAPRTPAGPPEQPFPDQVVRHLANCLRDAEKVAGPRVENYIAFTLGWFSHVVSDALFKGVYRDAAAVDFFGEQYSMKMLPAAESLTMTDISHDFGVCWPVWHRELRHAYSDGGALKHIAMGDPPDRYDSRHWTAEFGAPDPMLGCSLDALPSLNRRWFREMYVQPDYSAPTPRLDRPISTRASWAFGKPPMNLGQLRRYATFTGWYETFIHGVDIYLRVLNQACEMARVALPRVERPTAPRGVPPWGLWKSIVASAMKSREPKDSQWGSVLGIGEGVAAWLHARRNQYVTVRLPEQPTDYQKALAPTLKEKLGIRSRPDASRTLVIGSPAFNPSACAVLCVEDAVRLKYDQGLAAVARLDSSGGQLLLAGLSDFGDNLLHGWIAERF